VSTSVVKRGVVRYRFAASAPTTVHSTPTSSKISAIDASHAESPCSLIEPFLRWPIIEGRSPGAPSSGVHHIQEFASPLVRPTIVDLAVG